MTSFRFPDFWNVLRLTSRIKHRIVINRVFVTLDLFHSDDFWKYFILKYIYNNWNYYKTIIDQFQTAIKLWKRVYLENRLLKTLQYRFLTIELIGTIENARALLKQRLRVLSKSIYVQFLEKNSEQFSEWKSAIYNRIWIGKFRAMETLLSKTQSYYSKRFDKKSFRER